MPNWCVNSVEMSGPNQEIENLWSQMTSGSDIPQPMNCLPIPEHFERDGWYEWAIANWGTKWDMDVSSYHNDKGYIALTGYTAWSPCLALWEHLSRLYPSVTITTTFYEEGMDFVGASRHHAGESVVEEGSLQAGFTYGDNQDWDDESYVEAWYDHVTARRDHYYNIITDKENN